jgi:hypothetical protein
MQGILTSLKCPDPRFFFDYVEVICDCKEKIGDLNLCITLQENL